ncbi:MAG: methyltransferase domain-containing protein [Candidatus Omnitrophota bacterium]
MRNTLVRIMGWSATIWHADPCAYDRYKWLKRYIAPGPLRAFDAGCGNGSLTMYASVIGNEAVGMSFEADKNQLAEQRAQIIGLNNIRFITADLNDLDKMVVELGKFDQIICFEVIEHIQQDEKFIKSLSKLLNSQGRLFLTTPYKYHKKLHGSGHVKYGYTHSEIKHMFDEAGLTIQVEAYISGFFSQQLTNLMFLLQKTTGKTFSWIVTFPLRIFHFLDFLFGRHIDYPPLSIGVIGRRA